MFYLNTMSIHSYSIEVIYRSTPNLDRFKLIFQIFFSPPNSVSTGSKTKMTFVIVLINHQISYSIYESSFYFDTRLIVQLWFFL